ncbi:MAG TPA: cell wall hydrolase [Caulobacteraceae bacterium]|nr:cell wall hydrolase [Caulobacteraceae bacterium]
MTTKTQARAPARALVGAAAFGALVGLAVTSAYLGGTMAKVMHVRAKAERLAGAAESGFSETAVIAAAGGMNHSALEIARRHDPYTVAGGAQRDRQAALFAARLERQGALSAKAGLRKASFAPESAKPFQLNALDASRDLECLTQAVYYEARGEGAAGQRAVAQVVLNRVRHPAFPKTICGVVFQGAAKRVGCQFSFTCDGSMGRRPESGAWNRARAVAARALAGHVMAEVGNATHFHTTAVSPSWSGTLLRVGQVGTHVFYKFGGRPGRGESFRYTPQPSKPKDTFQPVFASFAPVQQAVPEPAAAEPLTGMGGPTGRPPEPADAPPAAAPQPETKTEAAPATPAETPAT